MTQEPKPTPGVELRRALATLKSTGIVEQISGETRRALRQERTPPIGLDDKSFAKHLATAFRDEVLAIFEAACYWRYFNTEALRPTVFELALPPASMDWKAMGQRTRSAGEIPAGAELALDALARLVQGAPPSLGELAEAGHAIQPRSAFTVYSAIACLGEEQLDKAEARLAPIPQGPALLKNRVSANSNLGYIAYERGDYARGVPLYRQAALEAQAPLSPTLDWLFGSIMSLSNHECRDADARLEELSPEVSLLEHYARRQQARCFDGSLCPPSQIKDLAQALPDSSHAQVLIQALTSRPQ